MDTGAENHYEILGVGPDADDDAVKQAFRELAKTYHPDYNPGDEESERKFKQVNIAYESLKDEARRQAYNEWLAFAEQRKSIKRIQWGRLAALIVVLLLGPSAILFWIAVPRDIAVVQAPVELPPPLTPRIEPGARRHAAPPSVPSKDDTTRKETDSASADHSQTQPQPAITAEREPVNKPETVASAPEQGASPKAAGEAKDPARQTPRRYEVFLKDKAADSPAPAGAGGGGDVTHALPKDQQGLKPGGEPSSAASSGAGSEKPDSTARGAARLLAELKEPEGASAPQPPVAAPPPAPKTLASRTEGSETDPFTDCPACPFMSLTRRVAPARRGGELAVSQSEVTVRQWNACVADRMCAPYRSVDSDPGAPVVGLSERAASQYTRWLSEITGYPYSVVMTLTSQPKPQTPADCVDRGQRSTSGGWEWLDEQQSGRDCPPSATRNRPKEKQQGFRVARRVGNNG
jgi:DnaJ-domain-containing protein 1